MSETYKTLSDLVSLNDKNAVDLGVSDLFNDAPLLKVLAATKASDGTLHKYLKESGAPVVGFRTENTGKLNSSSADTLVTSTLKLLDASFWIDKAIADAYKDGPEAFIAREAKRQLKAAMFAFEKQILGGTVSGDSAGFSGLANATTLDGLADTATVVNATGTTSSTGSSVYLIRTNDAGTDMQAVIGQDGEIKIDDTVVTYKAVDPTITQDGEAVNTVTQNGGFPAYYTPILGYMGIQIGSVASVVRICNLTADSGKGLTDALIYQALSLFPASRMPTYIVGNRRSRMQLQKSRTATNALGNPAPLPTEVEGIPFITTDAISSTETLIS